MESKSKKEAIKQLRETQKRTTNPEIKASIEKKINSLNTEIKK